MSIRNWLAAVFAVVSILAFAGVASAAHHEEGEGTETANPCGENPCGENPCGENPCGDDAEANPCGEDAEE